MVEGYLYHAGRAVTIESDLTILGANGDPETFLSRNRACHARPEGSIGRGFDERPAARDRPRFHDRGRRLRPFPLHRRPVADRRRDPDRGGERSCRKGPDVSCLSSVRGHVSEPSAADGTRGPRRNGADGRSVIGHGWRGLPELRRSFDTRRILLPELRSPSRSVVRPRSLAMPLWRPSPLPRAVSQ